MSSSDSDDQELLLKNDGLQQESNKKEKWSQSKIGKRQFVSCSSLLIVTYIQVYALLASLSLTWPYPKDYSIATGWVFIFNLDFWELAKVYSAGYKAFSRQPTPSKDVMGDHFAVWYSLFALFYWSTYVISMVVYFCFKGSATKKQTILPRLKVFLLGFWYFMTIPVGVNFSKVYWCLPNSESKMDVDNELFCLKGGASILYFIISTTSLLFHFVIMPIFYARKISLGIVTPYVRAHENALLRQLHVQKNEEHVTRRELEFEFGINRKLLLDNLYYHSQFKRKRAYFLITDAVFKGSLIVAYSGFFKLSKDPNESLGSFGKLISTSVLFSIIFVKFFYDVYYQPFRTLLLNMLNYACLIFLFCNAVFGLMLNIPGLESPFQDPQYLKPLLIMVNLSWFLFILGWIFYAIYKSRHRRIWPSLYSKDRKSYLVGNNERFVEALREACDVIEQSRAVVPLFAPAHRLKFQILKMNALTREAEYTCEILHPTLQECLQTLIETYGTVQNSSMFTSVASNMNQNHTAEELFALIPEFAEALAKRDLALALSRKHCRRSLLKVSAVAAFKAAGQRANFLRNVLNQAKETSEA